MRYKAEVVNQIIKTYEISVEANNEEEAYEMITKISNRRLFQHSELVEEYIEEEEILWIEEEVE